MHNIPQERMSMRPVEKIILILVVLVLVINYFALPKYGFHYNDAGQKYVQMKVFVGSSWQRRDIPYPGEAIDPDLYYITGRKNGLFTPSSDGRLYSMYQILFPLLTSFFYPISGIRGILIIPMITFFLSIIIFRKTLNMVMSKNLYYYLLLFTFCIASPMILYSFTFWEHMPAVFIAVVSLYYLTKYFHKSQQDKYLFYSFFILGFILFFRSEAALFILALFVGISITLLKLKRLRSFLSLCSGIVSSGIIYMFNNLIFYADVIKYRNMVPISDDVFYNTKDTVNMMFYNSNYYFIVSAVLLIVILYDLFKNIDRTRKAMGVFFSFMIVWFIYLSRLFEKLPVSRLFFEFPLCLLVFYDFKDRFRMIREEKFLENTIIFTFIVYVSLCALVTPLTPHSSIRYFLPIIPCVILFIALKTDDIFTGSKANKVIFISLVIISLFITVFIYKNDILFHKNINAGRIAFLSNHTKKDDVVVFSDRNILECSAILYFDRIFMVADDLNYIEVVFTDLKREDIGSYYVYCYDESSYRVLLKSTMKDNIQNVYNYIYGERLVRITADR